MRYLDQMKSISFNVFLIVAFLFLSGSNCLFAQESDTLVSKVDVTMLDKAALDSAKTFRSLADALSQPDKVYKLDLSKKKLKELLV